MAALVKYGAISSLNLSSKSEILAFSPEVGSVWKSTMVCGYPIVPSPTTVGGGVGASIADLYLQINQTPVCEFRILDTYFGIAGSATLVIPFGDGISFATGDEVRWVADTTIGTTFNSARFAATFFGML